MIDYCSPRRLKCQAIRTRSNREGPLRLGRFIRACESQRKYTDLPRIKLSEEIQKRDSTTILVDSEFFLSEMLWDMNDKLSAEDEFKRFVGQFEGAEVTFAMGSKGKGDDSLSSCDEGEEEPGALSSRKPREVDTEVAKKDAGASLAAVFEKLSDNFDGLPVSHATISSGAQGIVSAANLGQGIVVPWNGQKPRLVEKFRFSKNKLPVVEASTGGRPGAPQRMSMSPPRPLGAPELKSQSDLNSGAHDKSRASKRFSPERPKCILLDPQVVKSPTKDVQPGSQGLDLADEDFELGSLEATPLFPYRSIPATRSFFVEMAKKHNYDIIQIDEEPGMFGETAAYTRQVALVAQSQAFTYAVVGGADFLCFDFRDTYDIRFTDVNPYGLAFEETTPFRATSIGKTLGLSFNGLILFTCVLGNRFCHQSRRIFLDLSNGWRRRGSLPRHEHEQASKALEEIRKFENNDYHTLFEFVSFGVGLSGHSRKSIEASFAYYSLKSSQENMDWNYLAANKSEATTIMDLPETSWRRGRRPQMVPSHFAANKSEATEIMDLPETSWRRASPPKRPENVQAKWTPKSRHPPLSPSRSPPFSPSRYPNLSPSRFFAKAKAKAGGFKCKWSGEPPAN